MPTEEGKHIQRTTIEKVFKPLSNLIHTSLTNDMDKGGFFEVSYRSSDNARNPHGSRLMI
jgi:hypothetical protein